MQNSLKALISFQEIWSFESTKINQKEFIDPIQVSIEPFNYLKEIINSPK